jgi:lysozyme
MSMIPQTRPRLSATDLLEQVRAAGLDTDQHPVFVAGIRGYYRSTMGAPDRNDRGIYDDAIFLVSPNFFGSYNGNTDPSYLRNCAGTGRGKGMAMLKPGVWPVYRFDLHSGKYLALCQRAGPVTVQRDKAGGSYPDTGYFGINIHRGGYRTTSSEGCQTIYPPQWESFIASAQDQAKRFHGAKWRTTTLPYVLMEAV